MEYKATFEIDCGVSPGYGVKYPDNVKRTKDITAEDDESAYRTAISVAETFADDYLSNPDNGLTTVQLLSLRGPNGDVSFNASESIVQRSMLEHLLDS